MARPQKKGMEYYSRDTSIHGDRKIRKLCNEFGSKGFIIFDYLLCLIYGDYGYYIQYDNDLCFDVADYLKCGINEKLVSEVVSGCVRFGLFNEKLFNVSAILTSSGIQKRYLLGKKGGVIDPKHGVIADETTENDDLSTQRKRKEKKENESKGNNDPPDSKKNDLALKIWNESKNSFCAATFDLWIMLCDSVKWKKKSDTALELSLKQLFEYQEEYAVKLLKAAISGNYQGLVFNDTDDNYKKWLNNKQSNGTNSGYGNRQSPTGNIVPTGYKAPGKF